MRRMLQGRTGMGLAFLLGLLIATAGTATAAKLITGKQIKDGSISSKDLSTAVRAQLAKAGVPGPKGDKGEPGPVTGTTAGGALSGSYPNPGLADGAVTTDKLAASAVASDAARLGGSGASSYLNGGVLSGHIVGVKAFDRSCGPVSGFAEAVSGCPGSARATLSPAVNTTATSLAVKPSGTVSGSGQSVWLLVNGVATLSCQVVNSSGCTAFGSVAVPAGSPLTLEVLNYDNASPGDYLVSVTLRGT